MLYQQGAILQHILKIYYLIIFHENDSQLVVILDYQLVKKQFAFTITKTFFIPCYSIKYDLSLDCLQHIIMHYIIALTNNSLSKSNFKRTN